MNKTRLTISMMLRIALTALVVGGLLFGCAGSWNYWEAWVYFGILFVPSVLISFYFLARDPEFVERRMKWREVERRQQISQNLTRLVYIVSIAVPGLDHRYGWSHVPATLVLSADALVLVGYLLVFRVFQENRYAVSIVEVEPGQQVVSSGPYAFVRHPMYAGATLMFLFTPIALGSYWALLVFAALMTGLVERIRDEEEVLLRELPGYDRYRRRVRWRLIPGLW